MPMLPEEVRTTLEQLRQQIHAALERWRPGRQHHNGRERNGDDGSADRPLARPTFRGPALDLEETDDAIIVRSELPGLRPEDVRIDVTANRLIIQGEKSEKEDDHRRSFHRLERRYGSFVRSIALPCEVEPDRATARYRGGVLELSLPKTAASRTRRIRVDVRGE